MPLLSNNPKGAKLSNVLSFNNCSFSSSEKKRKFCIETHYFFRISRAKSLTLLYMRQSNGNFKLRPPPPPPPSPGKPRAFGYLLCPGSGEFVLCPRGVRKIEPEVSGFKKLFFLAPKSLTALKRVFGRDVRV